MVAPFLDALLDSTNRHQFLPSYVYTQFYHSIKNVLLATFHRKHTIFAHIIRHAIHHLHMHKLMTLILIRHCVNVVNESEFVSSPTIFGDSWFVSPRVVILKLFVNNDIEFILHPNDVRID